MAFVLGRGDVGVAQVARIRVQADVFVLGVVGFMGLAQAFGRPRFAFGLLRRSERGEGLFVIAR